jgi:HSP20 family molecular chaperone IbpA
VLNRRPPARTLDPQSLAQAKEQLKSLGGLGAGLGQLLETVAKLSEAGGDTKDGSFSIGGPKSPLRGNYSMRVGNLSDITPQKRAKPAPRNQTAAAKASTFTPSLFESADGVMVVAEVGGLKADLITVTASDDGTALNIGTPDEQSVVALSRNVDAGSIQISIINGIMTANALWST